MKLGAWDYLAKPVMDLDEVGIVAQRAIEARDLRLEVDSLRQSLLAGRPSHPEPFAPIVTNDPKLIRIFQYVEAISRTAQPVLIAGRTGTGKELVARAVHDASRRKGAFVAVNAAGLDDQVFSDTLFGHLRGSFTGADQPREGMVARAAGGTLFLDEIGNLGELSQIKLLRLLQEGEYYPLGSDLPRTATARIVAATNRDLQAEVEAGKFRQDLYYRLCTHRVALPPLSERKGDLPLLLSTFVAEAADALGVPPPPVPPELPGYLAAYDFPGNVRELKAMVHDAVARCGGGPLGRESFLVAMGRGIADDGGRPEGASPGAVRAEEDHFPTLREAEESLIRKALALAGGNQGIAARYLGITRQGLNKKLNKDRRAGETG
jgi:DNA-binding NtrC family response regulator